MFTRAGWDGEWGFGFTSSFRMGQLLHHRLDMPDDRNVKADDLPGFMVTTFVDDLRTCLRTSGWLRKHDERDDAGTFLVARRGHLFVIHDDLQVAEEIAGFSAVGCGDDYALGALAATEPSLLPWLKPRARRAGPEHRRALLCRCPWSPQRP